MLNLLSEVRPYGIIIGSGIIVCIALAYYFLKKRGYNNDIVFNVAIICLPCAILGARIYYIVFDIIGSQASGSESTFAKWFLPNGYFTLMRFIGFEYSGDSWTYEGLKGLAIYGGLIFAALGAIIVRLINKKNPNPLNQMTFIQMLDAFFVFIILGQVIGRWGNFTNGEAHGNEVTNPNLQWFPYAVHVKEVWYQATFFYESFLNLIGFFLLLWSYYGKRKSFDGFNFAAYCIWYGTVRVFIEGLRTDSLYIGSVRVSQLLSGIIIAVGVAIILFHIVMARKKDKKIFIFIKDDLLCDDYLWYDKTIMAIRERFKSEEMQNSEALRAGNQQENIEEENDISAETNSKNSESDNKNSESNNIE
jgi:phosphatidylglycerol:prolipoprotein diacylglycerol transferase